MIGRYFVRNRLRFLIYEENTRAQFFRYFFRPADKPLVSSSSSCVTVLCSSMKIYQRLAGFPSCRIFDIIFVFFLFAIKFLAFIKN